MLFGGKRRQTFIGFDGFAILELAALVVINSIQMRGMRDNTK